MASSDIDHASEIFQPEAPGRAPLVIVAVLIATVLLCGVLALLSGRSSAVSPTGLQERPLPDGSILVLEAVTFGRHHEIRVPDRSAGWLGIFGMGTGDQPLRVGTADDRIGLWFRQYDPLTRRPLDLSWWAYCLVEDEKGSQIEDSDMGRFEVYPGGHSHSGGERPFSRPVSKASTMVFGVSSLSSFRHTGATFKLRVYNKSDTEVAEFVVPYPGPVVATAMWKPDPTPITRIDGNLAVTLNKVRAAKTPIKRAAGSHQALCSLRAEFAFNQNGKPSDAWEQERTWIFDELGNSAQANDCDLSPHENAWKLQTRFFRRGDAEFEPGEMWTIKGIPLPKPNETYALAERMTLQGVSIEIRGIGGSGIIEYESPDPGFMGSSTSSMQGGFRDAGCHWQIDDTRKDGKRRVKLSAPFPHLALTIAGMSDDHRIHLRGPGISEEHLEIRSGTVDFWFFKPPARAETVDLTIIVEKARNFECFIKPPQIEQKKAAADSSEAPNPVSDPARPLVGRLDRRARPRSNDRGEAVREREFCLEVFRRVGEPKL